MKNFNMSWKARPKFSWAKSLLLLTAVLMLALPLVLLPPSTRTVSRAKREQFSGANKSARQATIDAAQKRLASAADRDAASLSPEPDRKAKKSGGSQKGAIETSEPQPKEVEKAVDRGNDVQGGTSSKKDASIKLETAPGDDANVHVAEINGGGTEKKKADKKQSGKTKTDNKQTDKTKGEKKQSEAFSQKDDDKGKKEKHNDSNKSAKNGDNANDKDQQAEWQAAAENDNGQQVDWQSSDHAGGQAVDNNDSTKTDYHWKSCRILLNMLNELKLKRVQTTTDMLALVHQRKEILAALILKCKPDWSAKWKQQLESSAPIGLIMSAGNRKPLVNTFVTLNVVRALGCDLPITIFYYDEEMLASTQAFFQMHVKDVNFIDVKTAMANHLDLHIPLFPTGRHVNIEAG